jgi:hypothetical protein
MARHMAARFHEFDPWQESGVAVKEPVAQRWRVPVFTDDLRTGEPRPRDFVVSIVETCRRLGIHVRDYLGSVLPGLAGLPVNRIAELACRAPEPVVP